ncbi:hypothetical protein ACRCPS_31255 [Pseudomonas aeruginosa]
MAKVVIELDIPALSGTDRAFNFSAASPAEKRSFLRFLSAAAPALVEQVDTPEFSQSVDRWIYATLVGSITSFAE